MANSLRKKDDVEEYLNVDFMEIKEVQLKKTLKTIYMKNIKYPHGFLPKISLDG